MTLNRTSGIWRFRAPDVQHLGLTHFPCGGTTLFGLVGQPALRGVNSEEVAARVRQGLSGLSTALQPDLLYVGGGLTERPEVRECMTDSPIEVAWSKGRRFVGSSGGQSIGGHSAIIFDVGQTAIKVSGHDTRRIYLRPSSKMVRGSCDFPGIEFIRRVLARELSSAPSGAPVVLAIPGEVSDNLEPGHCSYRWTGRPDLVRELLPPGGMATRKVLVLNDAELAAESARAELDPPAGTLCLIVTLGFAPGGALLTPGRTPPRVPSKSQ